MENKKESEDDEIKSIYDKLKEYNPNDIIFLKTEFQEKIIKNDYSYFQKLKGMNIQEVYNILNPSKIKKIRKAKHGSKRYSIILDHSRSFEIEVIIKLDVPQKGDLGVITFIKKKINTK